MERELIHEKCKGCGRVRADSKCSAYAKPEIWWRRGNCPLADHLEIKNGNKEKVRVGQQKQRKNRK